VTIAAAVLGAGLAAHAGAADTARSRHIFGMVGFTAGQSIRLNVVNTLPPGPIREDALPPSPIRARLMVLDASGRLLSSRRVSLFPGEAQSLNFTFPVMDVVRLPAVQVQARVEVMFPPGPTTPPDPLTPPDPCVSSLEVVDTATARTTLFVSPAVIRGFNPQPDPPRPEGR
jgi:hypothetical protein